MSHVIVKNNRDETLAGSIVFTGTVQHSANVSIDNGKNIVLGTSTGTQIGTGATQKLAFYGATPIARRAGAAQAAVATTAATNSSPYGFSSQAQADALVALANELRAALVALGAIKGSA